MIGRYYDNDCFLADGIRSNKSCRCRFLIDHRFIVSSLAVLLIAFFATTTTTTATATAAVALLIAGQSLWRCICRDVLDINGKLLDCRFFGLRALTLLARATLLTLCASNGFFTHRLFGTLVAIATLSLITAIIVATVATTVTTTFAAFATAFVVTTVTTLAGRGFRLDFGNHRFGWRAEPGNNFREQAAFLRSRLNDNRRFLLFGHDRCWLIRRNALDSRFLTRLGIFLLGCLLDRFFKRLINHLVGRFTQIVTVQVIVAQAGDRVRRRFQMNVRNQQDGDLVTQLDGLDVRTLLVEQEGGDIDRNLDMHGTGVFLHRFLFEDAQDVQRSRLGRTDVAGAGTARAGNVAGFREGRAQALTRQFHQAKAADLAHLDAGTVETQGVAQAVLDFALGLAVFHVDEVDDDQATQVAQTQLAGQFVGSFEVGLQRRFLNVGTLGGTTGVDVDGNQGFGVIDDDGAAGWQIDLTHESGFDLVFNLEAGEQRHVVAVALDAIDVARHHRVHEGTGLLIDLIGVDQDFTDVRLEVIANGADHQATFEVDQEGAVLLLGGAFDGPPQLQQIVQIPLQFFSLSADGCSAGDQAHAAGNFQLIHDLAQFGALVTVDTAGNTATTRVVRHQNEVTAGQGNVGGQGGALVATFVLVYLNDQFLTFFQGVLDTGFARFDAGLEIGAGNFLEGQETVAVGTVVDEAGFERRFDAGNDPLVDVAFTLFLGGGFNVEINQFLTIDNGDTEFFRLCRIEKHAFHCFLGSSSLVHTATKRPCRQRQVQLSGCVMLWRQRR